MKLIRNLSIALLWIAILIGGKVAVFAMGIALGWLLGASWEASEPRDSLAATRNGILSPNEDRYREQGR